jgi:hypothetical protein
MSRKPIVHPDVASLRVISAPSGRWLAQRDHLPMLAGPEHGTHGSVCVARSTWRRRSPA